ncbi:MAG: hypothetical protein J6N49_02010 [Alphaproteobacteria bacterium]|nr:hypothetical protein [Alphaproteobacteria bacterium]
MGNIRKTIWILGLFMFTMMIALGSSFLKNRVQVLERRLAAINTDIQKDIAEIHVLNAEWSHRNTPDRLRKLAYEQLSLEKAKPEQIINYSALQFNYESEKTGRTVSSNKKNLTTLVKAEVKKK